MFDLILSPFRLVFAICILVGVFAGVEAATGVGEKLFALIIALFKMAVTAIVKGLA